MLCKCKRSLFFLMKGYFLLFLVITLTGCATGRKETKPAVHVTSQNTEALYPMSETPQVKTEGSLWQDVSPLGELFINPKARRAGDIITIKIVESSSATNEASTQTGRTSSASAGVTAFFGLENQFSTTGTDFNPFGSLGGSLNNDFDGSGTTKRSGDLTAYITAIVSEVLPNGNLYLKGSREVTVNNETQVITLAGIIRPRDISSNNIIESTYISNAKIAYSGSGVINEGQRPGWLSRLLDVVWPF